MGLPQSESEGKKKKKKRVVYLSEAALDITKRLMKENPTGPLFRNQAGNPWDRWLVASALDHMRKAAAKAVAVVHA